ncbi:uncharacterized protein LOC123533522 isoform X2 [Mercenaria mercenaria]|uniref:uncharacterized protein LOC123533522 isoform X2 n=1 Tax=Mercenaria mercenaria TaxID=6596 RepID=UPI00234E6A6E|nr:uncharacterized protein LOC123533522 isoform X2 [Mercenaria mercenaria]
MMSEPFTVSSRGPVPSQDFSSREHVPSQDFIMMNNNNNYLPGVSRLGDSVQLLRPPLLSNTPNLAAPNPTLGPNCALDTVSQQENASAGTNTFYSPQMNEPVASCSELTRRAKRRHTIDTIEEGCPSNKIHLTEDKIASHMKDLRIHNFSPPPGGSIPTGNQYVDTGQRGNGVMSDSGQGRIDMMSDTGQGGVDTMSDTHYPRQSQQNGCHSEFLRHSQRQWHDFKLLEEKLQMIDEDSTSENEDSTNSQPVLHIVDGIKVGLKTVLPQDILDKIRNPCQEVVLWSPGIIPPKKEDDPDKETDNSPDCDDMMEDSISANVPSCEEREIDLDDSGMETDPDDEIL